MIRCHTFLIFTLFCSSTLMGGEVDDILAKARARLGTEKQLESVQTIQYQGQVYGPDGEKQDTLSLTFSKPDRQLLVIESDAQKRTTGVNGFEGFVEVLNRQDAYKSGIIVLNADQVRRLLANAAENLYFFEGPEHRTGGTITLEGKQTIRGRECYKIRFAYACGLFYIRFFSTDTCELVSTINGESNQELVESDSERVGGILFPKKVETYDEEGDLIRTVVFEKILINEPVDDSIFDFPAIPASLKP